MLKQDYAHYEKHLKEDQEAEEVVEEGAAVTEVDEVVGDVAVASPLLATTTRAIGGDSSSNKFETKFYLS